MRRALAALAALTTLGCSAARTEPVATQPVARVVREDAGTRAPSEPATVALTILGTNDLHGHIEALPLLGGYVRAVRRARERDGAVVLVDAGDMFQGTLESNLDEGRVVVSAYNALGYDAAAIGNHEFDYGPEGPRATPGAPTDDPRGALRARAREARFPFLAANVVDEASGRTVPWENVRGSVLLARAGVRVGIIGVTTEATPRTTMPANLGGLRFDPLVPTIEREARELRAQGATVIVVAAHAGGHCRAFDAPGDLAACDEREEVMELARALPPGTVHVIVAGHTHQAMAHLVNGVAVIESYAQGRAFGRVDLTVDRATGAVANARVHPPRALCPGGDERAVTGCEPGRYEDSAITPDESIAALIAPATSGARARREQLLGVRVSSAVQRDYANESSLGNLVADLMRAAVPGADAAVVNGGGLRAHLPVGQLTYGQVYEALPFDNLLVRVRLPGAAFRRLVELNLGREGSIVSIAGMRAEARCERGALAVRLRRESGRAVRDDEVLTVATSDFLASGGDGVFQGASIEADGAPLLREAVVERLRANGGTLRGDDPRLFDRAHPRIAYPGRRPVRCVP